MLWMGDYIAFLNTISATVGPHCSMAPDPRSIVPSAYTVQDRYSPCSWKALASEHWRPFRVENMYGYVVVAGAK